MFDATRLFDQLLGGQPGAQGGGGVVDRVKGFARENPMLAGGLAGGLAGIILGRGGLGGLLKYGGIAAVGGLAYKAYRDWQQSQGAAPAGAAPTELAPPPAGSPFAAANAAGGAQGLAETLILAMVGAAKADGHVDAEERGRIYGKLEEGGLDAEELAFLKQAFDAPVDIDRIAAGVSGPEAAVQVYAASVMAIRADTPAEKDYLAALAKRLGIAPGLAEAVEKTVSEAAAPA